MERLLVAKNTAQQALQKKFLCGKILYDHRLNLLTSDEFL